jgi:hypothetical protein
MTKNMRLRPALHNLYSALRERLALPASLHLQVLSPLLARLSPREQRFVMVAALVSLRRFLPPDRRSTVADANRPTHPRYGEGREPKNSLLRREYLAAKAEAEHMQVAEGSNFAGRIP